MPTDPPLVSVVIPSFNYGHYVCEAVESALAQTYRSVEIIVVDDGSTDDTRERLAPYGERIRYIHQANQGLSAARNTGIREAKGEYIAFLDSDDAFHPRKLEIQMAAFAGEPKLSVIGTAQFSEEPRAWTHYTGGLDVHRVHLDDVVLRTPFAPSSAVVRKECFGVVGAFDTTLRSVEDREMWIRVATKYQIGIIPLPLTWYRLSPGSMSRNPERMEIFERLVVDRAFQHPELSRRWQLRRRALGLAAPKRWTFYSENRPGTAVQRLIRSFAWWPIPFRKPDVRDTFARPKLLVAATRRALFGSATASH